MYIYSHPPPPDTDTDDVNGGDKKINHAHHFVLF
jgi:hypothetical protein